MISISVQNLTKKFGDVVALKHLDLEIHPGELFFLLGPSGCGKTTLLRSLAGFYIPEEGTILFGDTDVTRLPPHKRNTGMMFQSYALWPHLTVAQNVAFGLEQRKVPKDEIRQQVLEALASVRMDQYADRKPNQLSGGQQQRVALARALVIRPRCLLLDEPLSNLDAKLRLEMRTEIRRICKEFSLTAIYVTHDQKEALSVSDRLAVLDQGHILQVGTPHEVYRRPRTEVVANFIGETNFIPGKVRHAAAGMAAVETSLGVFAGVCADPERAFAEGENVLLSIRPECWRIDPTPSDQNCIGGKIEGTIYLGETSQHQFRAKDELLKIFELNPRHGAGQDDTELYASVDEDDVVVIAKNP